MGKRKKTLNHLTSSLMYFCLKLKQQNNLPAPLINNNVTDNFWNKIQSDTRFQSIFSFDLMENFICYYMLEFNKNYIDETDVETFLNELEIHLQTNLEEYWLIAPLNGALLVKNTIVTDNLFFLDGNTDEGQAYLLNLIGECHYSNINDRKYRTDYKDVLIGYKIKCQHEYISTYYNVISFYLNALLHLYYYANIYPDYDYNTNEFQYIFDNNCRLPFRNNRDIKRIILSAQRNSDLKPARYKTDCKLDLSFFENEEHLTKFIQMLSYLLKEIPTQDKLISKILNSLKIFRTSLDFEEKNAFTGISMTIVLLMTASESLFLKHQDVKRENLKAIFATIYEDTDLSKEQVKEIVDKMYTLRSEFVHGGAFTFRDFNEDFSSGPNTNLLANFKMVFCKSMYLIIEHILQLDSSNATLEYFDEYIQSHKISEEKTSLISKLIKQMSLEKIEEAQNLLNEHKDALIMR